MSHDDESRGYVDAAAWPERLTAHVISPEPPHRLHGYQVDGDLVTHYSFAETLLLALTGALPDERLGRAFEMALQLCAPLPVQEAPTHAALLAQVSGARSSSVIATAAVALSEYARAEVETLQELLVWLEQPRGPAPESARAMDDDDRAALARLRAQLGDDVPALQQDLGRRAALLTVLFACGLRQRWQLETALVVARLGVVTAEARAAAAGSLRDYPINLPRFEYRPGEDEEEG